MAMARSGRSNPPYALIVVIFLLVVAIGAAILLYVQMGKARHLADRYRRDYHRFVHKNELNTAGVRGLLAAPGHRSAIGQAIHQLQHLELATTGSSNTPVKTLLGSKGTIAQTLVAAHQHRDESLLSVVTKLSGLLSTSKGTIAGLNGRLKELQTNVARLQQTNEAQMAANTRKLANAEKRVATLTNRLQQAHNSLVSQANKFQGNITNRSKKNESMLRKEVVRIAQLRDDIKMRDNQIAQLRSEIAASRPPSESYKAILAQADGKIISASGSHGMVYIDIGRAQHVAPGLTFAVYSPTSGVGSGKHHGGKADIQVVSVGRNESVARVTHLVRGQTIFNGDLIANPVFHNAKNRKLHFVIYGDFDLNGSGVPTRSSHDKIVRLVKQWGGVVDKKLSPETDFLILGSPPAGAKTNFTVQTPQTKDIEKHRQHQQDNYQRLINEARQDSVPILNANRFLAMVGYYNNTIVNQ